MSKKSFLVILGLSVVLTYSIAIVDAIVNASSNVAGLPFKFGSYNLFGSANTNYAMLFLDIIFWFIVLFIFWRFILNILKK